MLKNKYQYLQLDRIDNYNNTSERRYVDVNGNYLPSVTTILSETSDKTALIEWRRRIGNDEANHITRLSANIGTNMHDNLERYLSGQEPIEGSSPVRKTGRELSEVVINKGLVNVDEVWGLEKHLYFPEIYAGTADVIGIWKGQPAIMDFKNSRKPKKIEWIQNYFLQLCAYAEAHNEVYGTDITTGVIMMVSREPEYFGEYQEFEIDIRDYKDNWWKTLERFYDK